jgi:tetratricopeptide (TPR) repeat protein
MRWLITVVIVLVLAGAALSAPWWLPGLLAPLVGDAVLVESATTLAQLVLWVMAGLAAIAGVRWALRARRGTDRAMDADELEAAARSAGKAAAGAEAESLPLEAEAEDLGRGPGPGELDPAPVEGILSESLFGPDGALPPGSLTPVGEHALEEEGLAESLLGPDGALPPGSLAVAGQPGYAGVYPDLDGMELEPEPSPPPPPPPAARLETTSTRAVSPGVFSLLADLPDFYGREAELAFVRQQLERDPELGQQQKLSICSVSGMPGVGKTALALRLAHILGSEGRFPDAQLYIDLKGAGPEPMAPATALRALLTTVMGHDGGRPDDEDTLAHLWRGALQDRRVLLLLDNASGAAQVRPLLPGNSSCAVVITSQQRFALPGAGRLDLEPLGLAEARALLKTLVPRLEDAEADDITRLCGGLPLALRIVGNHLALNDDLSPVVYAARLADESTRLQLLRDPGEPALDVGAWLAASVSGLSDTLRTSWAMLGYLQAPFDVLAAASLWGEGVERNGWRRLAEGLALDRLRALRNRSLVTYDPRTGRFGQQVLLRLAARQEVDRITAAGGSAAKLVEGARRRLAYHLLDVALSADEDQRYRDLDADWPHLRAALERAAEVDLALLSDLVRALDGYWSTRGMTRERVQWNELAAKRLGAAGRQDEEGIHLGDLGAAYEEMGQPQRAIEAYGRAIIASRGSGDREGEAAHLLGVGQAYQELGDLERAILYYQQVLDYYREVGNRSGEGEALGLLGGAHAQLGDARRAIGYLQPAVTIAREVGNRRAEGALLGQLARAYAELGDAQKAVSTQEQALAIARATGDRREEASHLASLGLTYATVEWNGARAAAVQGAGQEDRMIPIRQIIVPPPRGVEVFNPEPGRWTPADQAVLDQALADLAGVPITGTDGADLTIQDIWSTTTPLTPGEWTTISVRLRNLGVVAAHNRFYVRMWFDGKVCHTWYLDRLEPGASAVGSVLLRVAEAGSHQITLHADYTNSVAETNEDNNVRTETWIWGEVEIAPPLPGQGAAPAEGEKDARLEGPEPGLEEWGEEGRLASIQQVFIPGQTGVEVRPIHATAWDQEEGPEASVRATEDRLPEVDLGEEPLWDEAPQHDVNNGADLTVLNLWSPTMPLVTGTWEMLACRIKNQGATPISRLFYTRMWFDNILIRTWYSDGLAAGRTAAGSVWVRVAGAGRHRVKVHTDVCHAVPEADKSNNLRTAAGIWQPANPDLSPRTAAETPPLEEMELTMALDLVEGGDAVTTGRAHARELWTQALSIYEEIQDSRSEEVRGWLAELDG